MGPTTRRVTIGLATVVAVVGLASCGGRSDSASASLPDVEVTNLATGSTLSLDEIDVPAVVNVWASSCAPCVREMPDFQRVASETPGVHFYGLNVAESEARVSEFTDELGVTYPQLLDSAGYASEALAIDSLPTTLIVDSAGNVVQRHRGAWTAAALTDAITAAELRAA